MSIKYALLTLLEDRPRGMGRLRQDFETATAGTWPVNVGQVYQTIQRLLRDGLVEDQGQEVDPETNRRVDVIALSDKGRGVVRSWLSQPIEHPTAGRDELVMKIALAHATGWDIHPIIHAQREEVMRQLKKLSQDKSSSSTNEGLDATFLTRERQIFDLEAEARWLDRIEEIARHSHYSEERL